MIASRRRCASLILINYIFYGNTKNNISAGA
jgi:hypothetical protein